MFSREKNRLIQAWYKFDWPRRVVTIAAVAVFAVLVIVTSFTHYIDRRRAFESLLSNAKVLSAWLAEKNKAALISGRPELADVETISDRLGVRKAVVFDIGGRVLAPLSLHGDRFDDILLFKKITSAKSIVKTLDKESHLQVFQPVHGSTGEVLGLTYLELDGPDDHGWGHLLVVASIIVAFFSFFIWWVVRDTSCTIQNLWRGRSPKRFEVAKEAIERAVSGRAEELMNCFESEWRKLVHVITDPVIVLDRFHRLIEMNGAAISKFSGNAQISEGRHIIDVLGNNQLKEALTKMLDDLGKERGQMVCSRDNGISIAIFSSGSEETNFKYTIICSEDGGRI